MFLSPCGFISVFTKGVRFFATKTQRHKVFLRVLVPLWPPSVGASISINYCKVGASVRACCTTHIMCIKIVANGHCRISILKHARKKTIFRNNYLNLSSSRSGFRKITFTAGLKDLFNLQWLYKETKKYYGTEGQQSIDPVVFL